MLKRLILFRHAKSSWEHDVEDHERPLADRGIKAAPTMGAWLAANGFVPDLALVSTARRAQQTWALAEPEFGQPIRRRDTRSIYEASPMRILDEIRQTGKTTRMLIVVGHNPGLEELARLLTKDVGGEPGARLREKFPTGAVAVLSFGESWADLAEHFCMLEHFMTPDMLG